MASFQSGNSSEDGRHHKRTKSSVLKSFMQHKRTPSNGGALSSVQPSDARIASPVLDYSNAMPFLPDDHPYSKPLGELPQNHQAQQFLSPPKTSRESRRPTTSEEGSATRSLHKKTLSSISLKSLAGREKESKNKESKPKKTKSSTNLATLLSRPKSTKSLKKRATEDEVRNSRDKENCSPVDINARPPPIYAQFSSDAFTVQPLGGKFLEDEIDLYTPKNYSPGKQRDFYQVQGTTPSLTRRDELPQRPKSTYLPSSFSVQDITRRVSNGSRRSADITRRVSGSSSRPSFERKTTEPTTKGEVTIAKRGSRVMAAVAAFGAKTKAAEAAPVERVLEDKDVDKEFEAMLDRRNIPEHQRGKMRNLALPMKKDFVKQDWAEIAAAKNGRPGTNGSDSSADATAGTEEIPEVKSKRPRSKTFTLSRKSSKETVITSKKPRPVSTISKHSRQKSIDSTKSGNSLTSAGAALASNMIAKAKGQCPDDFVSYLRKVQKPELIEVGRLHKLRLLLRNETVAWTDDFIRQGGMEEIVALLNRTMEVEWREEHEDLLLHEVLLCLKALCTTALALQHLNQIQSTLFPALLGMVFDEEKKGPSEFTTRNIISSLIFTYLKSAPLPERTHRAKMVLSYLRDPEPKEEERPVGFVLEMRHPRPYRVWCKEVVNVTKEVFWIFLHNHNVIARPSSKSSDDANTPSETCLDPQYAYMIKNFPQELPPVPAAPYVGGVEWDATNYLASHIEILNAILVCLPTMEERNSLREELRVSGWEKCMGGTLRLCKEKFYGGVHAGLRCWVAAAIEDGWDTQDVRCGPAAEIRSPVKNTSPRKKVEEVPKLAFDFKFEAEKKTEVDAWL